MTLNPAKWIYNLFFNAAASGIVDGARAGLMAVGGEAAEPPPPLTLDQLRDRLAAPALADREEEPAKGKGKGKS